VIEGCKEGLKRGRGQDEIHHKAYTRFTLQIISYQRGATMLDEKTHPLVLLLSLCLALPSPTPAAELKQPTTEAYLRYVQLTEVRMRSEFADPQHFLYFDALPEQQKKSILARLQSGQVVVEQMSTRDNGKEIQVPEGLVHHWLALGYIPGATRDQLVALAQDYSRHPQFYAPDVQGTHVLARKDQHFSVYYRFYRHAIVTYNTEFSVEPLESTPCSHAPYWAKRMNRQKETQCVLSS